MRRSGVRFSSRALRKVPVGAVRPLGCRGPTVLGRCVVRDGSRHVGSQDLDVRPGEDGAKSGGSGSWSWEVGERRRPTSPTRLSNRFRSRWATTGLVSGGSWMMSGAISWPFFRSLTPEEWETPSLCSGWRIRDVAVHLLIDEPVKAGVAQRLLPMPIRGCFSVERANTWWVEKNQRRTSESITKCFLEDSQKRVGGPGPGAGPRCCHSRARGPSPGHAQAAASAPRYPRRTTACHPECPDHVEGVNQCRLPQSSEGASVSSTRRGVVLWRRPRRLWARRSDHHELGGAARRASRPSRCWSGNAPGPAALMGPGRRLSGASSGGAPERCRSGGRCSSGVRFSSRALRRPSDLEVGRRTRAGGIHPS